MGAGAAVGERFDWAAARARLERVRAALDAGADDPVATARVLDARARALARPPEAAAPAVAPLDLVVFGLGAERYGVEARCVQAVLPLGELVALPGAPAVVLGVIHHRGRVLPVIDLRRLLEAGGGGAARAGRAVVIEAAGAEFALYADAVPGTSQALEPLAPAPAGAAGQPGLLRGVTPELVGVLDVEALARHPRVVVDARG